MKIMLKISLFTIVLLFFALFLSGMFIFNNAEKIIQDNILTKLNVVADLKVYQIEDYFKDMRNDIGILQNYNAVREGIPILTKLVNDSKNPEFVIAEKRLDSPLRAWLKSREDIVDIMLTNNVGEIIYSLNDEHKKVDFKKHLTDMDSLAFEEGKKGTHLSEIFSTRQINDPARTIERLGYDFGMLVSAPVYDVDNNFVGVIIMELDMAPIYKFVQDVTGLRKTGETLVAKKFGDELLMLNQLRNNPDAALKLKIKMGSNVGTALQKAVLSGSGSGELVDYRGKEGIGAWRYINDLNWAFVAKIDKDEAFDSIFNLRNTSFVIGLITMLLGGFGSLILSKTIASPIQRLTKDIIKISKGELNVQIDNKIKESKSEIGDLAKAFERTIVSLKLAIKKSKITPELPAKQEGITAEDIAKAGFIK